MSKENSNNSSSVVGMLGVAFVVLKLCKVIDWSWWWVTLPFWGGIALLLLLIPFAIRDKRISEKEKLIAFNKRMEELKPKSLFQTKLEEMQKAQMNQRKNSK